MPYRDAEILLPCPRCGASLARDERGRVARCLDGCGELLTFAGVTDRFGGELDGARPSSMWWKTTATACPSCQEAMRPMVLGDASFYRCAEHGCWFDTGSPLLAAAVRAPDEAAAAQPPSPPQQQPGQPSPAARRAGQAREARAAAEAREAELAHLAEALARGDDPTRRALASYLLDAETRIRDLERQVARLRQRLDGE